MSTMISAHDLLPRSLIFWIRQFFDYSEFKYILNRFRKPAFRKTRNIFKHIYLHLSIAVFCLAEDVIIDCAWIIQTLLLKYETRTTIRIFDPFYTSLS